MPGWSAEKPPLTGDVVWLTISLSPYPIAAITELFRTEDKIKNLQH
jgi:hypothetical protein